MSRRSKKEEEHEGGDERWLVSYADMITVLMALFIVLYAMSQVDQNKYAELRNGLASTFGHDVSSSAPKPVLSDTGNSTMAFAQASLNPQSSTTPAEQKKIDAAVTLRQQQALQRSYAQASAEVDRLTDILKRLEAALRKHNLINDVETRIDDRGLVVSLVSRHVVFENDLASLSGRGKRIIDTLSPVLADIPDRLSIDGHTNQVQVKPRYFDTDWDLSVARAVTVVRRLNEVGRISSSRLLATGAGNTRPLRKPTAAGAQEINKRVDIVVLTSLVGQSKDLLVEVAQQRGKAGKS